MKRRLLSIALIITLVLGIIFILTGCESEENNKENDINIGSDNTDSKNSNKAQAGNLADVVSVGDYVNYNANSGNGVGKSYTTEESLTGSRRSITFSSSEEMKWKVMSVDKSTGIVELMAEEPTKKNLYLEGKIGYKNAETVLNKIGEVYGYGYGAAGGRSITIEDINKLENYTPKDDLSEEDTFMKGTFINEDGIEIEATKENPVTMKYTVTTAEKSTNMIYEYQTKNFKEKSFWLASHCVNLYSGYGDFYVRNVYSGNVGSSPMFYSHGGSFDSDNGVMPVVSLKSNIQTNGKDENGAWNLKVN